MCRFNYIKRVEPENYTELHRTTSMQIRCIVVVQCSSFLGVVVEFLKVCSFVVALFSMLYNFVVVVVQCSWFFEALGKNKNFFHFKSIKAA